MTVPRLTNGDRVKFYTSEEGDTMWCPVEEDKGNILELISPDPEEMMLLERRGIIAYLRKV